MSVSEAGFLVFFSASLKGMLTLFTERNCAPDHRVMSARFSAGNKKPPTAKLSGVLGIRRLTMTYIARAGALGPSGPPSLRSRVLRLPLASWSHGAWVVHSRASIQNSE